METWKPIPDFEGIYEVSNRGRVRRILAGMGARPLKVLKPWTNKHGYPQVALRRSGEYYKKYVHRLVLHAFTGELGVQCNHKNGIKGDNRLENLEWCTPQENLLHATRALGVRRGSKHWKAKLTANDIREIRKLASNGVTQTKIAEQFSINRAYVSEIVNRHAWRHID